MYATTYIIRDKTMVQQLKSWLLNVTSVLVVQRQIFINKIHDDKWNQTRNHFYHLVFTVSRIPYSMCLFKSTTGFLIVSAIS